MSYWQGRPLVLVGSEKGSLHCLQACFAMAVHALTGRDISMPEAEALTGYVAGVDTWPHQAFLSLADIGAHVVSIERLDPHKFIADPIAEIRRLYPTPDAFDAVSRATDAALERNRLLKCLDSDQIEFVVRAPEYDDVRHGLEGNALPIVNLDFGKLHGTGSFEAHMVIVEKASPEQAVIWDPGPPSRASWSVGANQVLDAMRSPTQESGQVILVSMPR